MATTTTRLGLRKPDTTDTVNVVTDLNNNYDKVDTEMGFESRTSFPASPYTGKVVFRSDEGKYYVYNGSAWKEFQIIDDIMDPVESSNASTVTTTSTTYTSLATEVSVTFVAPVSGKVYVNVGSALECSGVGTAYLSYEIRNTNVAGSVVIATSDDRAVAQQEDKFHQGSVRYLATLTAGNTYFCRVMSRASSGTASYFSRSLLVEPAMGK